MVHCSRWYVYRTQKDVAVVEVIGFVVHRRKGGLGVVVTALVL